MVPAMWNCAVLAQAETPVRLAGNRYFPPASLIPDYRRVSRTATVCPCKGVARYCDVVLDG